MLSGPTSANASEEHEFTVGTTVYLKEPKKEPTTNPEEKEAVRPCANKSCLEILTGQMNISSVFGDSKRDGFTLEIRFNCFDSEYINFENMCHGKEDLRSLAHGLGSCPRSASGPKEK